MFEIKKLKALSHICAYCGKVLSNEEKTIDHVIPKSADGKTYVGNLVVCCKECNREKSNSDINTFLRLKRERIFHFKNYLRLIDNQRKNTKYSTTILFNINNSAYIEENPVLLKPTRLDKFQYIEYCINDANYRFLLNEMQSKILDYYLSNPDFKDARTLAKDLRITFKEMISQMVQINCLTGIFLLKNINTNGIRMNSIFVPAQS